MQASHHLAPDNRFADGRHNGKRVTMICTQCNDSGIVNAWAVDEYETEPCPACAVPAVYTVNEVTSAAGHVRYEVLNTRTGRVAMSTPDRASADLHARYCNLYEPGQTDPDWAPGSTRSWWARNGNEAA